MAAAPPGGARMEDSWHPAAGRAGEWFAVFDAAGRPPRVAAAAAAPAAPRASSREPPARACSGGHARAPALLGSIPQEVLADVLRGLGPYDLRTARAVSARWCHVADTLHVRCFGRREWLEYFGEVGEEPPLPPGLAALFNSPCPFTYLPPMTAGAAPVDDSSDGDGVRSSRLSETPGFWSVAADGSTREPDMAALALWCRDAGERRVADTSGRPLVRVRDTHLLLLVPARLNGAPLTLNKFLTHYPCDFYHSQIADELGDVEHDRSSWVLITKHAVPGTLNQRVERQMHTLFGYVARTHLNYTMSTTLVSVVALAVEALTVVRDGEATRTARPGATHYHQSLGWEANILIQRPPRGTVLWDRCLEADLTYPVAVGLAPGLGVCVGCGCVPCGGFCVGPGPAPLSRSCMLRQARPPHWFQVRAMLRSEGQ